MENLKVDELKMILKSRGLSCKGNKTALVQRLQGALDQHNSCDKRLGDDAVGPDDSRRLDPMCPVLLHLVVQTLCYGERRRQLI